MMPPIDSFLATWSPRMLSILRIVVGLLFLEHGTSKYLSVPVSPSTGLAPMSLSGINGMIELVGGGADRARLVYTSGRVHPGG
jgi:putative oxidoreductase